jgi:hypothetical protein
VVGLKLGPGDDRVGFSEAGATRGSASAKRNRMVYAMSDNEKVDQFFERYASALLARDAKAIAGMYAVPSLILFPVGRSLSATPIRPRRSLLPPGANTKGSTLLTSRSLSWRKRQVVSGPMSPGPTVARRVSDSATSSSKEPRGIRLPCSRPWHEHQGTIELSRARECWLTARSPVSSPKPAT